MRQMGLRAQWVKPWVPTTVDSDFSDSLQNILDEQFNQERPNAVRCSDITYVWTIDGFVYQRRMAMQRRCWLWEIFIVKAWAMSSRI